MQETKPQPGQSKAGVSRALLAALRQIADGETGPLDSRQDSLWRQNIARKALAKHKALAR